MQNKLFLKAADVCELLEVSTTSAYEIIANLNSELEKKKWSCGDRSFSEEWAVWL